MRHPLTSTLVAAVLSVALLAGASPGPSAAAAPFDVPATGPGGLPWDGRVVAGQPHPFHAYPRPARGVARVVFQQRIHGAWKAVGSAPGNGSSVYEVAVRMRGVGAQALRYTVRYRDDRITRSTVLTQTVWAWVPLASVPVKNSAETVDVDGTFTMAGTEHHGWAAVPDSAGPYWTSFRTGRHCIGLSGVLGATDDSDPDSGVVFSLVPDGNVEHSLQSPVVLTGETLESVTEMPTARVLTLAGTSFYDLEDGSRHALPAIGRPRLLCDMRF